MEIMNTILNRLKEIEKEIETAKGSVATELLLERDQLNAALKIECEAAADDWARRVATHTDREW